MAAPAATPTVEQTFPYRPDAHVSYALPFPALASEAVAALSCRNAYLLASGSLARNHPEQLGELRSSITVVGEKIGVAEHSRWDDLLLTAEDVCRKKPDVLVTLGGGSVTDSTKIIALVASNPPSDGQFTCGYLETLTAGVRSDLNPPQTPVLCIPTTLSAGEYSHFAGAVDPRTAQKRSFHHPQMSPKYVLLDPELSKLTPEWVWMSTGVRAIDHCVETMCSDEATSEDIKLAADGFRKLVSGLLRTKADPDDTDARLSSMLGARSSMSAVCRGVPLGGSHGIGHQLATFGVSHGHTSCVLCPSVMKYNAKVNADKQKKAVEAVWGVAEGVLTAKGLSKDTADLGDVLDAIFRALGMPRSLNEVGVTSEKFDGLAEKSLKDRWCATNPIPLVKKEQILDILQMAA